MADKTKEKIILFDTTLRDGQQCPGAGMSFEDNLQYARLSHAVGIDIIEAGFPAASELDFQIVYEISKLLTTDEFLSQDKSPVVASLCQLRDEQIDRTIEALSPAVKAKKAKMHVYLPVDPNLMEASLGSLANEKEVLVKNVYDFCKRAIDAGLMVEFSPEGYSRVGSNFDFCTDLIRAAVSAGADTINCPDTIGGAYRYQGENYFVNLMQKHADIIKAEFPNKNIIWSAHCHNDFGLAVENSINAVFEGPARQIEGCFNGIGERAGNAAIEQCIMIIKEFSELHKDVEFYTDANTEAIKEISDFVSKKMLPRQPHWPVSGINAAKHSSGGHTNAILKNPTVYQPFNPKNVGQEITFLFGPLSGGNHAKSIIETNGYKCSEEEKVEVSNFLKNLYSDRRKGITDDELMLGYFKYRSPIDIKEIDYWRTKDNSVVELTGDFFGETGTIKEELKGKDSALATLKQAIDKRYDGIKIDHYQSESVGSGIHARSLCKITVLTEDDVFAMGSAEDQDINKSAMLALIDAVNKVYIEKYFKLENES